MTIIKKMIRNILGTAIAWYFILIGKRYRSLKYLDTHRYVICVCAHNPSRRLMKGVINWFLKRKFHFVSQSEVIEAVAGNRDLPRRSIWFIFDDGWKGNLNNVLPLLRQHNIPATIPISPSETENEFAWPTLVMMHGKEFDMSYKILYNLPNELRIMKYHSLLSGLRGKTTRHLLSVDQVKMLSNDPLITVENHTNTHARCTMCSDSEFVEEVSTANQKILEWTGRKPTILFYPFGDWKQELDELLPECGVTSSANSGNRFLDLDSQTSTYSLPRIAMLDDISIAEATCRLLKSWVD